MNTMAILLSDTYKQIHNKIYPKGLTKLVSYWTPRRSMLKNQNKMVFFGLQAFIEEYLVDYFNKNFFELTAAEVEHTYKYSMDIQLGNSYDLEPIMKLHKLGYLPIRIRAIPEGTLVPMGIPCIEITNTHPDFAWVVQWIECILQVELWKPCAHATIEVIGITIDEHGWANVEELIQGIAKNNPGFNKEILEEIVQTDNKQRYSFNDDKTLIRANQGHSIPVDVELEEKEPPKILYHGTGEKYIVSINHNGLIPKSRLYVHLSKDVETAKVVGKRHGKEVVYSINSEQMYKDGYKFYLSKNGVWLTKRVPVKYLMKEV